MKKNKIFSNLLIFISKYKLLSNLFSIILILIVILNNIKLIIKKKSIRGLALSHTRFRDDINILNQSPELSIYRIPVKIQYLLLIPFQKYLYKYNNKYFYPLEELRDIKLANQKYLSKLLDFFFRYFKFILSASVSYLQDYDLSKAAKNNGLKYIVLQRENFGIVKKQAEDTFKWHDPFESSSANLIIVHNQSTKKLFQNTKLAKNLPIKALGCLRMDHYIDRLKNKIFKIDKQKKTVTFFSFATNSGCHLAENPRIDAFEQDRGLINFFKNTHNIVINFAKQNPSIQVNIKTKWSQNWIDLIFKNWIEYSGENKFPNNCNVTAFDDPHELIIKSDLVIGFNSTTLLEACLRDIPIIIPKFDEASDIYNDYFDFEEYKNSFIIANNPDEFNYLLNNSLLNTGISEEIKDRRKKLFQNYVSSLDGQSKGRYIEAIKKTTL